MATIINNRSSLITDPIRNFRFLVKFLPHNYVDAATFQIKTFSGKTVTKDIAGHSAIGSSSTMGFTSVSGLSVTTDSIPYREGGYNTTVHQIPGQTTFAPITLQRGLMIGSPENWGQMRKLFATVNGGSTGTTTTDFRFDLEISVLTHPIAGAGAEDASKVTDHVSARFHVYNCWITSLAYSDLAAGDNAIFVEQMSLVHEGFDAKMATNLTASGSAADF